MPTPTPATTALAIHACIIDGVRVRTVAELRALLADLPGDLPTESTFANSVEVAYCPELSPLSHRAGSGLHAYLDFREPDGYADDDRPTWTDLQAACATPTETTRAAA